MLVCKREGREFKTRAGKRTNFFSFLFSLRRVFSFFFPQEANKFFPFIIIYYFAISSLIASLCFTFAEPFDDIFLFVKLCNGQRKYKQKLTDRSTQRVNSHSLTKLLFRILQNSRKNEIIFLGENED